MVKLKRESNLRGRKDRVKIKGKEITPNMKENKEFLKEKHTKTGLYD